MAPPLGPYLLHDYLNRHGVACDLLNRDLDEPYSYIDAAERGEYDVIGFGVTHDNIFEDLELVWMFRDATEKLDKRVIFIGGGAEATLNYQQWLPFGLDLILLGFAQKSLTELARRVEALAPQGGETLDVGRLVEGMRGVAFRDLNGKFVYTPTRQVSTEEFDELFYDEFRIEGLPYSRYWDIIRTRHANTRVGAAHFVVENARLYTNSHCPRKCGFCNSQSFLPDSLGAKQPILMLSAERTAELVRQACQRHGAYGISFNDDDFLIGNKAGLDRALELCERIQELKARGAIPPETRFACQTRLTNFLTREQPQEKRQPNHTLMAAMKKAGFNCISMGVETFIDRIMKSPSVNKLGVDASDCKTVINALLQHGLTPQINLILGVPEYTPEELGLNMEIAFEFLSKGCDVGVTRKLLALPGAPIYGSPRYTAIHTPWRHPRTGEVFQIAHFFQPEHPLIRHVVEHSDEYAKEEMQRIIQRQGWEGKLLHRRVIGLSSFIAVARLLGRDDLVSRFRDFVDAQVQRAVAIKIVDEVAV